jgi:hypothetical protein
MRWRLTGVTFFAVQGLAGRWAAGHLRSIRGCLPGPVPDQDHYVETVQELAAKFDERHSFAAVAQVVLKEWVRLNVAADEGSGRVKAAAEWRLRVLQPTG